AATHGAAAGAGRGAGRVAKWRPLAVQAGAAGAGRAAKYFARRATPALEHRARRHEPSGAAPAAAAVPAAVLAPAGAPPPGAPRPHRLGAAGSSKRFCWLMRAALAAPRSGARFVARQLRGGDQRRVAVQASVESLFWHRYAARHPFDATFSTSRAPLRGHYCPLPNNLSAVLVSPIQSTIRRVALAVGARVQPGQTIVELDKDLAASTLAKLDDEQLRNQNKNAQLQLSLTHSLTDLQAQQQTQDLKVSSLQSALRDEQHLLEVGGGTAEAVRQAELNLRTARLEAQRLNQQLANQRQASRADRRELGFTVSMQQRAIQEQAAKLRQADISSQLP
nr:hypothetical protein [Tanacetum cinerariifolium]